MIVNLFSHCDSWPGYELKRKSRTDECWPRGRTDTEVGQRAQKEKCYVCVCVCV